MKIIDIDKKYAEECKQLLFELRPNVKVNILDGDVNLYKLGFIDYYPCVLEIYMSEEEIDDLMDEILDMEINAFNIDERLLLKDSWELTDEEKIMKKSAKKYMKRYERYAPLYGIF